MWKVESEKRKAKSGASQALRGILFFCVLLPLLFSGCATRPQFVGARAFDFQRDTFAYANELKWEYHFDAQGKWVHERREPPPDYTLHCFAVARAARQFFQNASFDPGQPIADVETYRLLVRRITAVDPARPAPAEKKIIIPGYANLRSFSEAQEKLLKAECGAAARSYFQRGNWRMVFPFSRASQERTARLLLADLQQNRPPVVHLVRFPQLTLNHAVLAFAAQETPEEIIFSLYDPNQPDTAQTLKFDRATRTFSLPTNHYFLGGRVDAYEVYRSRIY